MQKKKLRKAKHHEKVLAGKKMKRKTQKMRRKQKLAELRQLHPNEKGIVLTFELEVFKLFIS